MDSQFKDALEAVNDGILRGEDMPVIRLALRIADKVMQEPSEGMKNCDVPDCPPDQAGIFRAMIEQMMKEIQG